MNTYHLNLFIDGRAVSRETAAPDISSAIEKVRNLYGAAVAILTRVVSINGEAV